MYFKKCLNLMSLALLIMRNSSISSSYFFFIFLLSYFPVRLFQSHCRSPKITLSKDSQNNQNLAIRYWEGPWTFDDSSQQLVSVSIIDAMNIKTRKLRRMSKKPGLKRNYVLTVTIFRGWTEDFTFRSGVNGSFYLFYIYIH